MKHTIIKPLLQLAARLSLFQRFIITISIFCIATLVWYQLGRPIYRRMINTDANQPHQQTTTNRTPRLNELIDQRVLLQQKLQRFIVNRNESPELISLCTTCSKSGVTLNSCTVQERSEYENYRTTRFAITCSGSLSSIATFFIDVEKNYGAHIASFSIKPDFNNRYNAEAQITTIGIIE